MPKQSEAMTTTDDDGPDSFVPDPQVRSEFNVSDMTLMRWTANKKLGFPPPIKINGRNFRSRRELEKFKQGLLQQAIKDAQKRKA
jgi:hypothetical protein